MKNKDMILKRYKELKEENQQKSTFDIMDEVMRLYHSLTEYLIEYAKNEIKGNKIKGKKRIGNAEIENNAIIKEIYGNIQKKYRMIEEIIRNCCDNIIFTEEDELDYNQIIKERQALMIEDIQRYLEQSYQSLRYIDEYNDNGELTKKNIFANKPFENLHETEFILQNISLNCILTRIEIDDNNSILSFKEKAVLLDDLANSIYYEDFAVKQVQLYIDALEKRREELGIANYEETKQKFYEQKYLMIYQHLNNKYSGILQDKDISGRKTTMVKEHIEKRNAELAFEMNIDEIQEIIQEIINDYSENMKKVMEALLFRRKR